MTLFRNLTLAAAVALSGVAIAADVNAPDIFRPGFTGADVIHGLSNNGKYGVASINPDADGFSYTVGAVFYDLTGSHPEATDLGKGHSASGANDVTDDGLTVVGSVGKLPAVCRLKDGKWTWESLPVPDKTIEIPMEDFYTGEKYMGKFKLNGGEVNAVSPDGRYAVGLARSNENELLEQAVMWDLETMKIIETGAPVVGRNGVDDHQSRFLQVSDDGRYILCWNSFSYSGSIVFVYDRQNDECIYIDLVEGENGFEPRVPGFSGLEIDGSTKSLSGNGRYVAGGIQKGDQTYIFRFDVKERELKIYDDAIHSDATGWSVNSDGLTLGAFPAVTPYADAIVCTDDFLYPLETLYTDVYGMTLAAHGIDVTGKPTLLSEDGKTVVFVTGKTECYVARFKESILDGVNRINLMSSWSASPASGTRMTELKSVEVTFDNPVAVDASRYAEVRLLAPDGSVVATALENGGLVADGNRLLVSLQPVIMEDGLVYTLGIPAGVCWLQGHESNKNNPIEVKYVGRADVPVKYKEVSPASGAHLASLDLNDNPVVVSFDVPVKINGTADSRKVASLYIDGADEPAASLALDVDLYTNRLVIYPANTYLLYRGSEYTVSVPAGVVTDLSGHGESEAFTVTYNGAYVPQLGDERYIFKSTCDDFTNFLFYEGDHGEPTVEYANMGFTADNTPWWVVMDEDDPTGNMAFASHSSYKDARQSDDWFATRQLSIPENVEVYLTFQSQSYRKRKTDYLKVYVYEDDASYSQLTSATVDKIREKGDLVYDRQQSPGDSEVSMAGEWTDNTVSLEKYKGKKIYICFLNDNKNQSMVMVDNIYVVRELKAFVTVTSPRSVVAKASAPVAGIVTVASDLADYSSVSMTLLDGEGNKVSELKADGLSLKEGDTFNFEFPDELPLTVGSEVPFRIEYTLDDDAMSHEGFVRDLSFKPEKRVVVEEYTGRDCKFCPLGIIMMERLESLYGDKVIPVALHAYSGSDPKGAGILGYAQSVFMGGDAAPMGRINRRPSIVSPMASDDSGRYHVTASELPEGSPNLWQDEVADEFNADTFLDLDLVPVDGEPGYTSFKVKVRSALNLEDQNVRVLGVLLEDGLVDFQSNGVYNLSDPLLGEFGLNGKYGKASFYYVFDNVARGFWGQGANGTSLLIPSELESGREYEVALDYRVPAIVEDETRLKMVVMLIDETTGRVINANVSKAEVTGVGEITDEAVAALSVYRAGSDIVVEAASDVVAEVYALDGRLLGSASGFGTLSIGLEGHRGLVIVRASSAGMSVSEKVMF